MSPDDLVSSAQVDGLGEELTAEEQAAFDAMRDGGEVTPPSDDPPPPPPADPPKDGEPPPPPPPPPSDDDDIEVNAPVTGTKQKRVSIHKYQRLEQRAKEAEEKAEAAAKERQELLERTARADERLKIISEAMATPPAEERAQENEDPPPDPAQDIFAYAQWQGRQIQKLNDRLNGIETGAQSQTEDNEVATTYQRDAGAFAAKEPAFAEAYVYLIQQRDQELLLAGVTDPKQRERQIVSEEKGLVKGAIKQGKSPAELIFNMAKGRGYVKKAAPPPPPPADGKDPKALDAATNGSAPPAAAPAGGSSPPPAAPAPSVTAEIEAIKRGQEAAASLSNVGGGAPVRELTSKVLADMSEEEFNDLVERLPREKLMELMGN